MSTIDADAELVARSYFYGFPLVFNLEQVTRFVDEGIGANPPAAFNTFSHARTLADPKGTFVSINNDTVYSVAQLDLSVGPVALHVPDTAGRYYVLQFVDAWTNNFAYIGHRATGTGEGDFLLVPPAWDGEAPEGATVIRFPTLVATIIGRWAVESDQDLPAVRKLQDATTLTPLDPGASATGMAVPDASVPEALLFFEKLRVWSQQFPPADRDAPLQESLAPLGIAASGPSPYADLTAEAAISLTDSLEDARIALDEALHSGSASEANGWKVFLHGFDYNLDFFEVGALDDDEFTIQDPRRRIVERATSAISGLWGNHAYEAVYALTFVDDHGDRLNGSRTYTLRLSPTPPVDAFWSITMYSVPEFYLVDNPIDRYSIGDRTPGIVRDDDGALTITISHEQPADPQAAANWLPAPAGDFRPGLRMYEPRRAVLDGTYVLPPITRTR